MGGGVIFRDFVVRIEEGTGVRILRLERCYLMLLNKMCLFCYVVVFM